jgi:hypothetical protein
MYPELFLLLLAGTFVVNLLFGGGNKKGEFHDNVVQNLVNLVESVSPENRPGFVAIGEEIIKRFPNFTKAVNATLVYHSVYSRIMTQSLVGISESEEAKYFMGLYRTEPLAQTKELILSILYMKVQIQVAMVYFSIGEDNLAIFNDVLETYPETLPLLHVYENELIDICKFLHVDEATDKVVPKLDHTFVPRRVVIVE